VQSFDTRVKKANYKRRHTNRKAQGVGMIENPGRPATLSSVHLTLFGTTFGATSCVTAACGMENIATTADEEEEFDGSKG